MDTRDTARNASMILAGMMSNVNIGGNATPQEAVRLAREIEILVETAGIAKEGMVRGVDPWADPYKEFAEGTTTGRMEFEGSQQTPRPVGKSPLLAKGFGKTPWAHQNSREFDPK